MKYAFIQRHKLVWPISVQCRVLLVSVSGYHQHLSRRVHIASAVTSATRPCWFTSALFMRRIAERMAGRTSSINCERRAFT